MVQATTVRETERKYDAVSTMELPDPAAVTGYATIGGPEKFELSATYFDTADLRLLRAGVTLRRRCGGDDAGWHMKLPTGGDSRSEVRMPLGRERRPPERLLALTRVHAREARLDPVAELTTLRRRWRLADERGVEVAELVDDCVVARTMGRQTTTRSWREVEVELAEGAYPGVLDTIESRLLPLGMRRARSSSKLARALAEQISAPRDVRPTEQRSVPLDAGEVVLSYLRKQAEAMRRQDPLVRQDAPDAVHQMRVAARRMRSALQSYRRVIDRDATRELIGELRWIAGELAGARDTEVMAERFGVLLDGLPDELVLGPVRAEITRVFERRYVQARDRALAALDSARYLALQHSIDALLADPPLTKRACRPPKAELPASVRRAYRRLAKAMRHADGLPVGSEREVALHEARKAAKRLRYASDAAAPPLGKGAKRLRKRLKAVQSVLGDHQDTVVARPVLRDLGAAARSGGGNGFSYGLMYGLEQARGERAEADLPEAWQQMRSRRATAWLKL